MPFMPLHCIYGKRQIPKRYVLVAMLHLAIANSFQLRLVLKLVLKKFAPAENRTIQHDACPEYTYLYPEEVEIPFKWSPWLEDMCSHFFFIGYTIGHIPGGWLADSLGAKHVLGACVLISAILTMLLPMTIERGYHYELISLRAVFGFAQGFLYPSVGSLLQCWIPYSERNFIGGLAYCGYGLGSFWAYAFTGSFIRYTGSWRAPFYIWGGIALLWYVFYVWMVFSKPNTHPFIDSQELNYLNNEIGEKRQFPIPWLAILSTGSVWALFMLTFADSYTSYTLEEYFNTYVLDILKWDIKDQSLLTALPYLLNWVSSIVMSWFAGQLLNRKWWSMTAIRKVYSVIGNILAGMCLLITAQLGCNRAGAFIVYLLALCLNGATPNCMLLNANDLTRYFSGIVMAITNGLTAPSGILGPWFLEYLSSEGDLKHWQHIFGIFFGGSFAATAVFVFFSDSDRQPWDYPPVAES